LNIHKLSQAQYDREKAAGNLDESALYLTPASDYIIAGQKAGTTLGDSATAEGDYTTASGGCAHAEGSLTEAVGSSSHAEGIRTAASGLGAHAEGGATNPMSSIMGTTALTNENIINKWKNAMMRFSLANGMHSHVEGKDCLALATNAHAEGNESVALGLAAHAEGTNTIASGNGAHAEGSQTTAFGNGAHAEGGGSSVDLSYIAHTADSLSSYWLTNTKFNMAFGEYSHAEGNNCLALGDYSHAEGFCTYTGGLRSHAEGIHTRASGDSSHAEGYESKATGNCSHAECGYTTAHGSYSHAEGLDTTINSNGRCAHIEGLSSRQSEHATASVDDHDSEIIGDWCSDSYSYAMAYGEGSHVEGKDGLALGDYSHAEGNRCFASGSEAHAEGNKTIALGQASHAEGSGSNLPTFGLSTTSSDIQNSWSTKKCAVAFGLSSHVEGKDCLALGAQSHAEGYKTHATSSQAHAEGYDTRATGTYTHAEGYSTDASGSSAHAEGYDTTASGSGAHAEGSFTKASGSYSHAGGYYTTALASQYAIGHFNDTTKATAGATSGTGTGAALVIGNGTTSTKSNAFRVDYNGKAWCKQAYASSGADYAEYFEWLDQNPENEDRRGYFVTMDGEMIKKAEPGDYILGIVSGMPAVLGNTDIDWSGRHLRDEFGSFIVEEFEYEEEEPVEIFNEETGETTVEINKITKVGTRYKENPDYDPDRPYIQRDERPEWSAVGMMGVLSVRDDGSCQVNGYCKVAEGGIATASESGYRVISRINDYIVKVIFR
jgi:hypothetical protein